jgi:cAMP-dependent protein kinase regulator
MAQEDDLKAYLDGVAMGSLVKDMTSALAGDKPDEPIGFLIKYLKTTYPEQSASANISGGGGASAMAPSSSLAKLMADAPDDDTDDEEEEDDADAPVYVPPVNMSKKSRKTGFSAESMDPSKMKEKMKELVVIPKEQDVKDMLLATVAKSTLLKMLDQEQKDKIVDAFAGPLVKEAGENVIVQGENGDVFYLLEDGAVDVYIKKGDADEVKVHTYKPGDAFGELAIMYNAPRAATCRASETSKLWSLDRLSFKVIVVAAAMLKREMYAGFLEKVPILETCNAGEIQTLADSLSEEVYEDDVEICKQGDAGNYFYIIKEGTAKCYINDNEVASLDSGMYFGEIALMTAKPRQATVKAKGSLKVLALDRATFTRVLGSMEDIMKRNMDKYKEYIGSEI